MPSVIRRSAVLGAALSLCVAGAASADTVSGDADLLQPSAQTFIDLGTRAAGATIHLDVGFILVCRNLSHVDPGVTLAITPGGTPQAPAGGSITATATTLGPVPAAWPADGQPCVDDPELIGDAPSHVTIVLPSAGGQVYQYSMGFGRSPADGLSLATSVGFRVTVPANTGPTLVLPASFTAEADTVGGWTASWAASATDAEDDPDPAVTCTPAPGAVLPLGSTSVACMATDGGGLTATGQFQVTVVDTQAPTLHGMSADRQVTTTDPGGAAVTWTDPTATDVADPAPYAGCSPASGSMFPVGTSTVTCTATDAGGNATTASFSVVVTKVAPQPVPVPAARLVAVFDEPVANGAVLRVRGDRTVPVKVRLWRDGQELRSGQVWLWASSCDGSGGRSLTRLDWRGGRWVAHLDASVARHGCAAITVRSGGSVYGGFELRVQPERGGCGRKSRGGATGG